VTLLDTSVEQVAALAAADNLPEPFLSIDTLQPNTPGFSSPYSTYRQATLDPWSAPPFASNGGGTDLPAPRSATTINGGGGATSSLAGSGLPREWWNKQEHMDVTIQGQQGFILNRYTVYEITSEVRAHLYISFKCTDMMWHVARLTCSPPVFGVCVSVGLLGTTIPFPSLTCSSAKACAA
jgi:sorting nexin-8